MILWLQVLGVTLIAAGVLLIFITAMGMVRLGSLFSRMHAATKPQVVSLVVMCTGLAMVMQRPRVTATLVLVVVMQFVVAPISAHMLGRAVYRLGQANRDVIVLDEYAEDLQRAAELEAAADETGKQPPADPDPRGRQSVAGVPGGGEVPDVMPEPPRPAQP